MYYFQFTIPKELTEREPPGYSPGWFGYMKAPVPTDVIAMLYNDKDGWGIAFTASDIVLARSEVQVLTAAEVQSIMDSLKGLSGKDGVWQGEELAHRWDVKPEPEVAPVDGPGAMAAAPEKPRTLVGQRVVSCPQCHRTVGLVAHYDDGSVKVLQNGKPLVQGIIVKNLILTCPSGHKVKVVCGGK